MSYNNSKKKNNLFFCIKTIARFLISRYLIIHRDVAQFGSAPVLGTGGRRFESCHPDLKKKNALSSVGRT